MSDTAVVPVVPEHGISDGAAGGTGRTAMLLRTNGCADRLPLASVQVSDPNAHAPSVAVVRVILTEIRTSTCPAAPRGASGVTLTVVPAGADTLTS